MFNKKGGVFYHPLMLYFFNQFQCMAIIFSSLEGCKKYFFGSSQAFEKSSSKVKALIPILKRLYLKESNVKITHNQK